MRESIILFISASEVGAISIPWNLQGNECFKKKLDILSPHDVNLNFQELKERNY
jgi:hypothetical protein